MKKIIGFFRKILLIDFVLGILKSKQLPHKRFAGFLTVFSYMWLAVLISMCLNVVNSISSKTTPFIWSSLSFGLVCLSFFFLYRHTAKILRGYTEEEFNSFGYLRYINPVAPIVYFTTTFLIIIAVLNIIMFTLFVLGTLLFFLLIVITLGLALLSDEFKLDNFISVPKKFFKVEEYFLDNIIGPQWIILFLIMIYFLIPFITSVIILVQHYRKNPIAKSEV